MNDLSDNIDMPSEIPPVSPMTIDSALEQIRRASFSFVWFDTTAEGPDSVVVDARETASMMELVDEFIQMADSEDGVMLEDVDEVDGILNNLEAVDRQRLVLDDFERGRLSNLACRLLILKDRLKVAEL